MVFTSFFPRPSTLREQINETFDQNSTSEIRKKKGRRFQNLIWLPSSNCRPTFRSNSWRYVQHTIVKLVRYARTNNNHALLAVNRPGITDRIMLGRRGVTDHLRTKSYRNEIPANKSWWLVIKHIVVYIYYSTGNVEPNPISRRRLLISVPIVDGNKCTHTSQWRTMYNYRFVNIPFSLCVFYHGGIILLRNILYGPLLSPKRTLYNSLLRFGVEAARRTCNGRGSAKKGKCPEGLKFRVGQNARRSMLLWINYIRWIWVAA